MLTRRTLLAAAATPLLAAEPATLRLWPGDPPGGGGPSGPVEIGRRGAISNVAEPFMEVVAPARPGGTAFLIAAGGGYKRIEIENEARPAARWLAARGITAYVLAYRLPVEGWQDGPLAPLQDARRALQMVRARTAGRVGVLGFSAGGHLMGLLATDPAPDRPDAAALIYPVVTLEPPYDHTSTRRSLIGNHADEAAAWSVQTHVRAGDPAMFLVQAADDPISNPANTAILAQACQRAGVPVERHLLASGGHGFGMGRPETPSAEWPTWFESWLTAQRLSA